MGQWEHLEPWDTQVLAALAENDVPRAFEALVQGYQAAVVGFCTSRLENSADGEDVALNVFLAAYRTFCRSGFRGEATLRTWVFAIARKQCGKYVRRVGQRRQHNVRYCDSLRANMHPDPPASPEQTQLDAEEAAQESRRVAQLLHCLQRLPKRERILLEKRYYEDLSFAAIADRFWLSESTMRRRVQKAEERLRACLEKGSTSPVTS